MTGQAVLIAAISGRALAASARRAGYRPLVADRFSDADTREIAAVVRHLPGDPAVPFETAELLPALRALAEVARSPPVGLVLGAGFERAPEVIEACAREFKLIGNGAETVRACKDPARFFTVLAEHGVRHPETRLLPPEDDRAWLRKPVGGSGGIGIQPISGRQMHVAEIYYQRVVTGRSVSLLGAAEPSRLRLVGASHQWCAPSFSAPYRYGGAAGPIDLAPELDAHLAGVAERVARALDLRGLVSFDFLLAEDGPLLLEVNPRPGATLDVFDDATGPLFAGHLAAFGFGTAPTIDQSRPRAAAILYADSGPVTIVATDWPSWTADRPATGTVISPGDPICTVMADALSPEDAEGLCRHRLRAAEALAYGRHAEWEEAR